MINYFKNKNRNKVLSEVANATNMSLNETKELFENVEINRKTRVVVIKNKDELKKALLQSSCIGTNFSFNYYLYSDKQYAYDEDIKIIKGNVKAGIHQIITKNGCYHSTSCNIEPQIIEDDVTIFLKVSYYYYISGTHNLDYPTIYVYNPR